MIIVKPLRRRFATVFISLHRWWCVPEYTLKRNVEECSKIALRQRVLNDMSQLSLETELFDETLSMPMALACRFDRDVCPPW